MKLLFIGNSHTFVNEVPHSVAELFRLSDMETPDVVMLTGGGMNLEWHCGQPSVWFSLKYGHFDHVVLQDVAHPFVGRETLLHGAETLIGMMDRTEATPCLYMTWASAAHPEVQQEMIDVYTEAAERFGTLLAPVGRVWERVRFGHPEIDLFHDDGEHAGPLGSYLAACVIFCTLTGRTSLSPDMSDPFYDKLDRAACAVIHENVAAVLSAGA